MILSDRAFLRRIWPVSLCSLVVLGILLSLGFWQLERREWKHDLIARIEAALAAEPIPLSSAAASDPEAIEDFTKVTATGQFSRAEQHVFTVYNATPGWRVISPFTLKDGGSVLVDRGFAPEAAKETRNALPQGEVTITGVVRRHPDRPGLFTPDNRPDADIWYWWDLPTMTAVFRDGGETTSFLPFIIQIMPSGSSAELPMATPVMPDLQDRHLGYAITWFGLAACLIVVYIAYIRSLARKP